MSRHTFSPAAYASDLVITSGYTSEGEGMEAQARGIYDKLEEVLGSLDDVTHVAESIVLAGMDDYDAAERVRRERLGDVAVTTVCVDRLIRSSALIEIHLTAGNGLIHKKDGSGLHITAFTPPGVRVDADAQITTTRVADPFDVVSSARDDIVVLTGRPNGGDIVEQALAAYESLPVEPQQIIQTIEYVTADALPRYPDTAAVRRELLAEPFPAATGLVCHSLRDPGQQIEIVAVAVL